MAACSNLQELRSIQSEAFATLASIEAEKGDSESAQQYYELAIEAMAMNVSAILSSAKLYFDEGALEASRARLENIRSLPSNVKASLPVLMRTSKTEADWSAFVSDVLK
jgi:Tfp pilus assembly protein PilF